MKRQRLRRIFYAQDTHTVARNLLGKLLVRRFRGKKLTGRIGEVESYVGENDQACHAAKGRTGRTEVMFGEAGHAYVYLVYGMYHCLNVVTERDGFPAAVLIRGLIEFTDRPMKHIPARTGLSSTRVAVQAGRKRNDRIRLDGPGKLCRAMHISKAQNGVDLAVSDKLYIVDDGFVVTRDRIKTTRRVGVEYAGRDALLPWRYVLEPIK